LKKIISLFQRNYSGDKLVRDEIVPGAEWVQAGEGLATEKFDGTACLIKGGQLFKRYDAKQVPTQSPQPGQSVPKLKAPKAPPPGFVPTQEPDPITGHWPGWVPVGDGPEDQWYRDAWVAATRTDGTAELCGPKFQSNPYALSAHVFRYHGSVVLHDAPRDFDGIKTYLAEHSIEGIVWHHADGRMVKIKARDFGLDWPRKVSDLARHRAG
jgi:uncharacterized protein DUF5565